MKALPLKKTQKSSAKKQELAGRHLVVIFAHMKRTIALASYLLLFTLPITLWGQNDASQANDLPDYSLSTPRATVETHLRYLQPESYYPELAAKSFQQTNRSEQEAIELAVKLKQVLDAEGILIELDNLPSEPNYVDSAQNNRHVVQLTEQHPQITLERIGENWYYSEKAARAIPTMHRSTYPFGVDRLLKLLPKQGSNTLLGLQYWQYVALFILIFMCFLLHRGLTWLFARVITRMLHRWGYKTIALKYIRPLAIPISMLGVVGVIWLFEPILLLPVKMQHYIVIAVRVALPFFAFSILYRLVDVLGVYMDKLAERTETKLDDQLVPLVRKALRTFVVVIGVLVILQNLNVNVTAILAGLSIGGLALALAAQDTLKNFFGSVMIFLDRPFQIGHWITAGEIDGTVEEVGFRSTRVRTFRNSLVSVPNGKLADMVIDNHGLRKYRRFFTHIAVTYDTPPHLIDLFVKGLKEIVANHPDTRKDYYEVHLNEFGDSSLNVFFYIFFEVPSWSEELRGRHEVMLEVIHLAERLGIRFAFPTQTLHVETFPEKKPDTPEMEEDLNKLKKEVVAFLEESKARQEIRQQERDGGEKAIGGTEASDS